MTSEETSQPTSSDPVGQQLQRARELKGLSAGDVAKAQHLRPAVIQAIEAGDYHQIDSELFLKGYVRAYAKQVGLDANEIIADLDRELEPMRQKREQEFEANPLVDIERRRRRKRRAAKSTLLLGVVALAGYLVFTFVLPRSESLIPSAVVDEAEQEQDQNLEQVQEQEEPVSNGLQSQPESAASEADEAVSPSADAPATSDSNMESEGVAVDPVEEASVPEQPVDSQPTLTADSVMDEPVAGESVADSIETPAVVSQSTDPVMEDPAEPVVVTDTGRLQITFTDDCWVQVSDAAGNRLVNSLQRSGDRIDVSGDLPLRVVIGAVDAVGSIRFQDEPVDMGDFRVVNNRSEFTLTI
ncbi:RodZ domain-containing protein [Marinobacter sp. F4206]|uniref:RodZ domain-containing protein n=1 Tax=Marinobacter sp. F4206 TaxID=2861777 RepID=UPI001C5D7034|nr:RodZ domain-containing protein [Marinobacter sp. F4206]MBW4936320.1 DUF4115 domain-containing protein [Marinobacter sp. F4206]